MLPILKTYLLQIQQRITFFRVLSLTAFATACLAILLNVQTSLRLDEAQSIWVSTKTPLGILAYIALDVHVPLYALLLHFWIQLFGTSLLAVRSLSILFFLATIPLLYILTKKTANERVALITVSLFFLSPFLTWYSTETRMYTMLTFFSVLSSLAFLHLHESKARSGKLFFAFATLLGLYTHYFFAIQLFLQGIYALITFWKTKESKQDFYKTLLRCLLPAIAVVVGFTPWILYVLSQGSAANTKPLLTLPTSYNILMLFVHFLSGFQNPNMQNILISFWPILVILLFLSFSQKKKLVVRYAGYYASILVGSILLAFVLSYTVQPVLVSRYLIFIAPCLFYILAVLLEHFHLRIFEGIMAILFLSNILFQYQQTLSPFIPERENYKAATEYLNTHTNNQDIVLVTAPFTVYPIEYYYQGAAKIETAPRWNRYVSGTVPSYSEEKLSEQIGEYREKYRQMYVILSYDQGYEDDITNYLDNHLELKNRELFSPGLEARLYQLRYDSVAQGSIEKDK